MPYAKYHRKEKEQARTIRRRECFRLHARLKRGLPLDSPKGVHIRSRPPITAKTREKMSLARRGEKHPFFGAHHTEKAKKENRLAHMGKHFSPETEFQKNDPRLIGKNNPNWKGRISSLTNKIRSSVKYRRWRFDIFTRDDFTCQKCGKRGGDLEAHHDTVTFADIMELNDIRTFEQAMQCVELWDINSGLTLCKKCHKKLEKSEVRDYECASCNVCRCLRQSH